MDECQIHAKASLTGQFNFPEDTQLISGVYWISCPYKFVKPVTVEIQHSGTKPEYSPHLTFVVANCTQKNLPYNFEILEGGVFSPSSQYGSIELTHFSGLGAAFQLPKQNPGLRDHLPEVRSYRARLYYSTSDVNGWEVYFAIMWNLKLHIAVSN